MGKLDSGVLAAILFLQCLIQSAVPNVKIIFYLCDAECRNAGGGHIDESVFALSLTENVEVFKSKRMDEQHSFLV